MAEHQNFSRLYPVEVSGWDHRQGFFVENTDLAWSEDTGKSVTLSQHLRENAILFVRLLQSGASERSHPVVYEAMLVGKSSNGRNEFRLQALAPRLREPENSVA